MSASAWGGRAPIRTPSAGLLVAWKRCRTTPDPIGLDAIRGNNRKQLRVLAKLVHCLCDGTPGIRFYLGSVSLGTLLGVHQRTAHRWIRQLEERGLIRRVWTGRPCKKDERGRPLPGGRTADRASEFVYLGLPNTR